MPWFLPRIRSLYVQRCGIQRRKLRRIAPTCPTVNKPTWPSIEQSHGIVRARLPTLRKSDTESPANNTPRRSGGSESKFEWQDHEYSTKFISWETG